MRGCGGFQLRSERPAITLVCFGRIDDPLREILISSLEDCIDTIQADLPERPEVSSIFEPDPAPLPAVNQQRAFYPVLEKTGGDIVLGVTGTGFYDPDRGRFIFGYGKADGQGLLSTYRFRKETAGHRLLLERLGKQIIKTLAMACAMSNCADPQCVVSSHRYVDDLDRNRYVCRPCRKELVRGLSFFLRRDDGKKGADSLQ